LEVDSFVHEVRTFDRHFPACGKVDQSEATFICICICISFHAGCACLSLADVRFLGQLLRLRFPSPTSRHDLGRLYMPASAVLIFGLLF
jgi:hypothetical protein